MVDVAKSRPTVCDSSCKAANDPSKSAGKLDQELCFGNDNNNDKIFRKISTKCPLKKNIVIKRVCPTCNCCPTPNFRQKSPSIRICPPNSAIPQNRKSNYSNVSPCSERVGSVNKDLVNINNINNSLRGIRNSFNSRKPPQDSAPIYKSFTLQRDMERKLEDFLNNSPEKHEHRLRAGMDEPSSDYGCCASDSNKQSQLCYLQNKEEVPEECPICRPAPTVCGATDCPMSENAGKSKFHSSPRPSMNILNRRIDFEPFYIKPTPRVTFRKNWAAADCNDQYGAMQTVSIFYKLVKN